MSLVRLLPAWLHAIADYAVGIALIVLALSIHASDKATAAGVVIGAVILVVSMLTRYPLGVIKVLPFKIHSAADYLAVALLIAAPFALGFTSSDRALTIIYLAAGAAVLAVSLVTNYQYSPKRQAMTAEPTVAPRSAAPTDDRGDAARWYAAATPHRQPAPATTTQPVPVTQSWRNEPAPAAQSWRDAPAPAPAAASWRDEPAEEYPAQPAPASVTLAEVLAQMAALQGRDADAA